MRDGKTYSDPRPPFLDIAGARDKLEELGLPVSYRQVRNYFDQRMIPWFRGPNGRRYVAVNTLEEWLLNRQRDALQSAGKRR